MIEERIKELGLSLPEPTKPVGSYIPCKRVGNILFLSGVISEKKGKLGENLTVEEGYEESKKVLLKLLANLKNEIGTLDKVKEIIKVEGFVSSNDDFFDQPKVINGASDLLFQIFGEKGKHSRVAIGVKNLPLNAAIEISMIVEVYE
ncbi:MAG: RidA family protein [Caldisericia bacterium]|jgi:enamine deaminase RidA (YjgF/YER057c/UK114 family)|nr:RidA family protein [Caldisericia bacterium]